jgi:hypothetical protein
MLWPSNLVKQAAEVNAGMINYPAYIPHTGFITVIVT